MQMPVLKLENVGNSAKDHCDDGGFCNRDEREFCQNSRRLRTSPLADQILARPAEP